MSGDARRRGPCTPVERPAPRLPFLPQVEEGDSGSQLFAQVVDAARYPPLLQERSWTRAAPHTGLLEYCKPSESIGSNYTPSARLLRLRSLAARPRGRRLSLKDEHGNLQPPPAHLLKRPRAATSPAPKEPAFVNLRDYLSGKHDEQRARQRERKQRLLETREARKQEEIQAAKDQEMLELAKRQADLPVHPDEQLALLHQQLADEQLRPVRPEDMERINYYLEAGIEEKMLEPFCADQMERIKKRLAGKYLIKIRLRPLISSLEGEVVACYKDSLRWAILQYILLDPREQERLEIHSWPTSHPASVIRAPVPWKQSAVSSGHRLQHNLSIGWELPLAVRRLWDQRYSQLVIASVEKLKSMHELPIDCSLLEAAVDQMCLDSRTLLEKEWLPACADLFLDLRASWQHLVPREPGASLRQVERFFRSVASLASLQLRGTVMLSLGHLRAFLAEFKNGNDFGTVYSDFLFVHRPTVTVYIKPDLEASGLAFRPPLDELRSMVQRLFSKIVTVNEKFPRVERIMFPEMKDAPMFLLPVVESEVDVVAIVDEALGHFDANVAGPTNYLRNYDKYLYILRGDAKLTLQQFMEQEPFPSLKEFTEKIREYERLKDEIAFLRRIIPLNFISLDCNEVNDKLMHMVDDLRTNIVDFHTQKSRIHNRGICDVFEAMSDRASEATDTTAQLVELTSYLRQCKDITLPDLRARIRITAQNLLFLMDHAHLTPEDIQLNSRVFLWPQDMEEVLQLAHSRLSLRRDTAEANLRVRRAEFEARLLVHLKELEAFKKKDPPILTMDEMVENVRLVIQLAGMLQEDKQEASYINEEEQLLDLGVTSFTVLQSMFTALDPLERLWHTVLDFHRSYNTWFYGPFAAVEADAVADEVEEMFRVLYKLGRPLYDVPGAKRVCEMVRAKVEKSRLLIPVLKVVCNKGLQPRHWEQISEVVGLDLKPTPEMSLSDMIEFGLQKHVEKLEEISNAATKEFSLERSLTQMKHEWDDMEFECKLYRDTGVHILTSVDNIQQKLDDDLLRAQTIRSSPFVRAFEKEMQAWEAKLISMQDILDAWLKCQMTWLYLEPIFSSEDIMRQMPDEAKHFRTVDKTWREIMANTVRDLHVLIATDYKDMLKLLKQNNSLLEVIQKGLNNYLEKKRLFFPRFFFLSNDELLEILSETKDPHRVQPHLKKCFEGIHRLEFTEEDEIVAMVSSENEIVEFSGVIIPADAKGMVEKWLQQVEENMMLSVKDHCLEAVAAYLTTARVQWLLDWPGQVVICATSIHWTTEVSEAIDNHTLKEYAVETSGHIEEMVLMVRGELTSGARITVVALIVITVHARDVVDNLAELNVSTTLDFNWICQLRYYWLENSVTVSMITTQVQYGFEYLGNTPRLVITPLTDRCYRTLMGALKLNLGGAPEGPAGTGKTETTKDLAKAVAKQCIVFNCSDGLDYKAMGKFFKGLAQAGAWACFDEFNRIELEVLSVVAQQILSIQMAIGQKLDRFVFEGTEISLDPTCSIFITMNPGYAGRQELPDNLKVLFRTVAMMVPDYGMIGEISLYSMGFVEARSLAEKIVYTYKLCSELLSSQHHYDYGMRAVKTVLLAAGNLKLKYLDQPEPSLVFRAIIDVNLPKFLAKDVPLFEGIYQDLFPGIELPQPDRDELVAALRRNLALRNLQATDWYLEKLVQLYEMVLVRHGLMVVGEPMGGKTNAYQVLAVSLTDIAKNAKLKMKENRVHYSIINPKAITMGQLYGFFDPVSHEWSDGVLAKTFRDYASSVLPDRRWIVFDGPVDAVWIENLNTVLDDNKKLCLMSGEIIKMSAQMNLMFEPCDLDQASPATVSRCGMIYMEPAMLGWAPMFQSYRVELEKQLLPEQTELVAALLDWLVPPVLSFVLRPPAVTFIRCAEAHMFQSFCRLLTCLLSSETQVSTVWLQCVLLFCLVWGMAAALTGDSRKQFDVFFRGVLYGTNETYPKPKVFKLARNQLFPERETVFDFVYDKRNNGTWIPWLDTVDKTQAQLPVNAKFRELMVVTTESSCQAFFLRLLLSHKIPLMFVGPTGTGKSAIVLDHVMNLPRDKFLPNIINFSARTTANITQEIIMSNLDRRRKGLYGPSMGKKCLLFVDNLSMPQKEVYGAQPPVELLRQWVDHGNWYDLKDGSRVELADILLLAAMLPPGGGSNEVTGRFLRHMFTIGIDSFDDGTLTRIFNSIMDWHLSKGFEPSIARLGKVLVSATLQVFRACLLQFLPTPAKCHYLFNLRHFSQVVGGLLLLPASHCKDSDKLLRLWVHEIYRVFYDRLVDNHDRQLLFDIVQKACYAHFRQRLDKLLGHLVPEGEPELKNAHIANLFFGNYMEPDADPKIYNEVTDVELLEDKMRYYLEEYNLLTRTPMNLVMFRYAVDHVSRVSRVLQQEQGHVMLVGVGGSGRQSVTKLAASISECSVYQIEISRVYGQAEWREDLCKLLKKAGTEGKKTVFLFADTQIKDEMFVEDISMILNTGNVPNLFPSEEKAEILEKMQTMASQMGKTVDPTPLALYNFFVEQVRANLCMALAMSPIGDALRTRLRMFPALVDSCTIDWFTAWPEDALEQVAEVFLKQMDLDQSLSYKCVDLCKLFHVSVQKMSVRFYQEHKRYNYVTPTSYLELLQTFQSLYQRKVNDIVTLRSRYTTGLEKLDFAAGQIFELQDKLKKMQPGLELASAKTEKLLITIEQETIIVERQKEIVGAETASANEAAASAQAMRDKCDQELGKAVPALIEATRALDTLKPQDITIVKSMKNPPAGVRLVLEAVCVMLAIKPDRRPDPGGRGYVDDYWGPSLRMLADLKFLENLRTLNKDNIAPQIMKKIRERYIPDPEFKPERVRGASTACEGLCRWLIAIEVYDRVIKMVAPIKERLAVAEAEYAKLVAKLEEKEASLREVQDRLQALSDQLAVETKNKKELEDEIESTIQQLSRAERLIGGLAVEDKRWKQTADSLTLLLDNIVGDVLLSAGVVAYQGAFIAGYRQELTEMWNEQCLRLAIPCSKQFSLITTLGEPVEIRAWNIAGLPVDNFSIVNGIIVGRARRWPLMIDPQGQANKWVKNMERDHKLRVVKQSDSNFLKVLQSAIELGLPVLLENLGEEVDPVLDPILTKQVFKHEGVDSIHIGENYVEYSPDFRFYMTTRLRNPHYLPELIVKVTLLNFMITLTGLEDQLLGIVVAKERPELEHEKNRLIVEGADNKRQLKELEDKILEVLSTSEGNILEDEKAVFILQSSKNMSENVMKKQTEAAKTEKEIDGARALYHGVSKHSSVLFFCISELANIDPMYQYSLAWFIQLYSQSIDHSEKSDDLQIRLANLNKHFTESIYRNVCRSLFEKDKMIFSLVLCVGIMRSKGKIDEEVWTFLLTGGFGLDNPYPNPDPSWLIDKSWGEIVSASKLSALKNFHKEFVKNIAAWKKYYDSSNPHDRNPPAPFDQLDGLVKLAVLRCIRPDKVVPAVQIFIVANMGQLYVQPPTFDLLSCYSDSTCHTPLIFILSPGSDPMASLLKFAADQGYQQAQLKTISLGQGQGPRAAEMVSEAVMLGQWVVLQNCHLAVSWMPMLDHICEEVVGSARTHQSFRLWLTSYPSPHFPVSILQNGVKMTNEAPKGLRNNLLRSYLMDPISDPTFYEDCVRTREWRTLLFSLVFFHALVQERRYFGPLGWNIPYEFNDSDLKISATQLQMFLNEYEEVPLDALLYLTGECNYGGRVTDDKDRRLLLSLLSTFYNQDVLRQPRYAFSSSGKYRVQEANDFASILEYISGLPLRVHPEVFGLHENADITKDNHETQQLLLGALLTQPQILGGAGAGDGETKASDLADDILARLPPQFDVESVARRYPVMYDNSMNTILRQELFRFNPLVEVIGNTLREVQRAVAGLTVMSPEVEDVHASLLVGRVPRAWAAHSYPSLKPLGSYVADLVARLKFFQDWIDQGAPTVFWISGFFFTQSFLTGVLQNFARKHVIPIDQLGFQFEITDYDSDSTASPEFGAFCKGLFLEGARWDRRLKVLNESLPKILFEPVPIIWLKPGIKEEFKPQSVYNCPVYKTSERRGVLSTTGHSTNFVMFVEFPSSQPQKHWINRGVACLCQLDN
ncbi:dynein axonemal heavy chain 3 [Bacillus rossius redtenbacheri]|uniref:dynein axonemal heavy chain 3 n=1 Tax=Bacillus rossius redtenbacheri TaxID=93214 RepID=UPI002FDCAEAC